MKTSDDKLDAALRAALQRKFDGFQEQPDPSAFERIMAALKPGGNWKYLLPGLFFIVAISIGVLTKNRSEIAVHNGSKQHTRKISPKIIIHQEVKQIAVLASAKNSPAVKSKVLRNSVAVKERRVSSSRIVKNAELKSIAESGELLEPKPEVLKIMKEQQEISVAPEQKNSVQETGNPADSLSPLSVLTPDLLDKKSVSIASVTMNAPDIVINRKTEQSPTVKLDSKISLLLNVSTLHTYQILTVQHSLAQRFQNFSFPSGLSMESLGYKFSAGFEKKHFQFLLHYNNFRQAISYEVAENEYIISPNGAGGYDVVRKGTVMREKKTFNLLGLGITKQLLWGRSSASKFYVNAGLEYSHALNSGQSVGWVNAGIGKQFLIHKNTWMSVGPYAEFSPLKVSGAGDPFYFQPYRIGLSIGIKMNQR